MNLEKPAKAVLANSVCLWYKKSRSREAVCREYRRPFFIGEEEKRGSFLQKYKNKVGKGTCGDEKANDWDYAVI